VTAPASDGEGRCRACGLLVDDKNHDYGCPTTRVPGFAKRGRPRGRQRCKRQDFVDVPLPGADEWDTSGFLHCWPGQHTDECGCRPLVPPNTFQDKDFR
jgi:hypothetical protein